MIEQELDDILIFAPQYKSVIWGGSRISQLKEEPLSRNDIGESWEISPLEGHESIVAEGPLKGISISELSERFGAELLGENNIRRYGKRFPLLIKLIDAHDQLSLQVHPNDEVAEKFHSSRGKSEMWYIMDAKKDARIFCGLSSPLTPECFNGHIDDKTIMDKVSSYESKEGQFYFIPAGTIHSIGAGNLIAEVQEASDITYRVYDYDRKDATGKPRLLHVDQAREAINYTYPHNIEPMARSFDTSTKEVVTTDHFIVDYYQVDNETTTIARTDGSFTVLIVTKGTIEITADETSKVVSAGHTVLIPASVQNIALAGSGTVLSAHI